MYPSFTGTEINERLLLEQLGEVDIQLETRFINTFNINQLKSTEGVYGSVKPCHGLPWCVYVSKESPEEPSKDETLGVYLSFINERVELPCSDILSCNVVVSLELINQLDESRSETADGTKTPTSLKEFHGGRRLGWGQFIIWDILANQENGFVDADNNFTVKVILKLIDVKRWK
ncbi:hypothetical protein SNE40_015575 [Patella caerulea]|uniref:MATH domain-containing protein n=1 Tax=Patella caerulea TaxID=87958 RepID=A0AAN8JK70_PATCE